MPKNTLKPLPSIPFGYSIKDPSTRDAFTQLGQLLFSLQQDHQTLADSHAALATSVDTVTLNTNRVAQQVKSLKVGGAPKPPIPTTIHTGDTGGGGTITGGPDTTAAFGIIQSTAAQYSPLLGPFPTDGEATAAAQELLLRCIWHLQTGGINAGRQRNPSGVLSNDKLTLYLAAAWHAYDIFTLGYANVATTVHIFEVNNPNHVDDTGIAD